MHLYCRWCGVHVLVLERDHTTEAKDSSKLYCASQEDSKGQVAALRESSNENSLSTLVSKPLGFEVNERAHLVRHSFYRGLIIILIEIILKFIHCLRIAAHVEPLVLITSISGNIWSLRDDDPCRQWCQLVFSKLIKTFCGSEVPWKVDQSGEMCSFRLESNIMSFRICCDIVIICIYAIVLIVTIINQQNNQKNCKCSYD